MTRFRVTPVPAAELERLRRAGRDDAGNVLEPFTNTDPDGTPLRCCLRPASVGEQVVLLAYQPPGTAGPYAEVGPIFVHAEPCSGYAEPHVYPAAYRDRRQVLRAYNTSGRMGDAMLVDGATAEEGIARLLADPSVAIVHSRNVLAGCYMFAIQRA
jgi:Protein of unknown function (DUF1203)